MLNKQDWVNPIVEKPPLAKFIISYCKLLLVICIKLGEYITRQNPPFYNGPAGMAVNFEPTIQLETSQSKQDNPILSII